MVHTVIGSGQLHSGIQDEVGVDNEDGVFLPDQGLLTMLLRRLQSHLPQLNQHIVLVTHNDIVTIILMKMIYAAPILYLLKGQVQGWGWFLTQFPLKLAENDDVGETVSTKKKAFSVIPKALPWCPNHVTICLLRHSGESLQNGQLSLRRRNWHFARVTHKDTAVSVWACQAGFWKSTRTSCQLRSKTPRGMPWSAKSHSLKKCESHKWAWCGAARKSARLNCINLIHFRLTEGQLRRSSCIVIPGVCKLLQFAATQ